MIRFIVSAIVAPLLAGLAADQQDPPKPPVLKVTSRAFGTGWRMPIVRQE